MENTELTKQNAAAPEDGDRLEIVAAEIRVLKHQAAQMAVGYAVEIGRRLTEAKAMVPHGEWGAWLKREVDYSQSTAQNLMRVYQECGDRQSSIFGPSKAEALGNLSFTKVLRIITIPEGPERDEFLQSHDVEAMTSRELERAIKERDAARLEAERAKAEQSAAEAAREKAFQDMALANARLEGLNAQLEEQSARAEKAQAAAQKLAAELEELRARPVEVAVETDTAAIEAARRETEAAMRARLDEAKAAAEQARAELMEANSAAQRAKLEREDARRALEEAQAEAAALRERAEKKAALTANEDLVLFRTLFDQAQEQVNKLGGVLMKFRAKDAEKAQGLALALLALADKIREVAEQ